VIDSSELECLDRLSGLTTLQIDGVRIDDNGAFHIGGLTELEELNISESCVTEFGMAHLSTLRKLRHLTMTGHFTPRGLDRLKRLKSLELVQLSSPYIKKADVDALAAAIPSLQYVTHYEYKANTFEDVTVGESDGFRREGTAKDREELDKLEGLPPPPLTVGDWLNADDDGVSLKGLKGKVIVVGFWSHTDNWSVHDLAKLDKLYDKYLPQGLAIMGIHASEGAGGLEEFVTRQKLKWPIAADAENATASAWHAASLPSYMLIDRAGTLRVARVYRADLERVIKELLAEK
jgi:peroxiredoxin